MSNHYSYVYVLVNWKTKEIEVVGDKQSALDFIKDNPDFVYIEKCANTYYEDGNFGL